MWSESAVALPELSLTAAGGEPRSLRDGAFKLLALIGPVVDGFLELFAGTGRLKPRVTLRSEGKVAETAMTLGDGDLIIESPHGWVFAFEGGAHILFRYTLNHPLFVRMPSFSIYMKKLILILKEGKLLRLAKRNKHTLPTLKKHQAVQEHFLPLLTPQSGQPLVVHTDLVKVTRDLLETLQFEQVRGHTKRLSELDLEESHGTLLEDLSADPSILLLEFKVSLLWTYSWS
jgi:hypothetical protein